MSASKDDELRNRLAKPALRACLRKPIQWLCSHTLRFEAPKAASDGPNGATAEPEDLYTTDVDARTTRSNEVDALVSKILACVENKASGRMLRLLVESSMAVQVMIEHGSEAAPTETQDVQSVDGGSAEGTVPALQCVTCVMQLTLLVLPMLAAADSHLVVPFLQCAIFAVLDRLGASNDVVTTFLTALPWAEARVDLAQALSQGVDSPRRLLAALVRSWFLRAKPALLEVRTSLEDLVLRSLEQTLLEGLRRRGVKEAVAHRVATLLAAELVSSLQFQIPQLADLLIDPAAVGQRLVLDLGRVAKGADAKLVNEAVVQMTERILRDFVGQENKEDIDKVCEKLRDEPLATICTLGDPRLLTQYLLGKCKQEDPASTLPNALLLCARAVMQHWVVELLTARGADSRVVLLARDVFSTLPVEKLEVVLHDPERMLQSVLEEVVHTGEDFASSLLEDASAHAKDMAIAKLADAGLSVAQAEALVDSAREALANPEQVLESAKDLSADELLTHFKQELASVSTTSALAMFAFFLRGRLLPLCECLRFDPSLTPTL